MRACSAAVLASVLVAVAWEGAAAQWPEYAGADSADAAEDALVGVDPGDASDVAEALAAERDAWGEAHAPRGARSPFGRLEWVSGYRASVRLTGGMPWLAVGTYEADGDRSRWIDVRTRSPLERVTVGGIRVHAGEGLVLGAPRSRFGMAHGWGPNGLSARPSLSLSKPMTGAAATIRLGPHRLTAVVWDRADGVDGRWVSVERRLGAGAWAVSGGTLGSGGDRHGVVSVSGGWGGLDHGMSIEVVRRADATQAVLRSRVRLAGEWTAEVFGGAAASTGGVATMDAGSEDRERGAALHREHDLARWRSKVSVYTVTRHGPDGQRVRRRADARGILASTSDVRLEVSLRYDLDETTEVPTGRLSEYVDVERERRARLRVRLDAPAGPSVRLGYHAQALVVSGARPGCVAGIDMRCVVGAAELRAAVANTAMSSGGSGYVARPGIAGYEAVSTTHKRGSDVSARATVRLGSRASVSAYAGVPWEQPPRYLVSLRVWL